MSKDIGSLPLLYEEKFNLKLLLPRRGIESLKRFHLRKRSNPLPICDQSHVTSDIPFSPDFWVILGSNEATSLKPSFVLL